MIALRDLQDDDRDRLFHWRLEPEVDRWMSDQAAQTLEENGRWFDEFRLDPDRRGWIITVDGVPAGFLTLTGLTSRHRRASWGWYIGDAAARGRGAGRAAQALGLDIAFDALGLEKVQAEVLADNDVALKAQAAAGFRREGYLRAHVVKDGRRRDVVLLGILAPEWRERRTALRRALTTANLIEA
ncbi:MAG TPA: UDP-4-amino-4,6-dideoxy-N-acetyl-beta-L-altrosamine N-acetyltransferase [Caulobacteraceae bacterium]|nr:UDP-4-amino-4,6-dideoxy-N-acetyl-beta-L-altrosamine N-acetyltransferase [Caulobacteraceae bacterium]